MIYYQYTLNGRKKKLKDNIKREDLKSNFLKTTVLRLDYDYLFEEDVEQIIKQLNTFLIKKSYKMYAKT